MIVNRSRFKNVNFLPESEIRPIGTIGDERLVYLGREEGTDDIIVSRSSTSSFSPSEQLFAVPLSEMLQHSQDPINITEDV